MKKIFLLLMAVIFVGLGTFTNVYAKNNINVELEIVEDDEYGIECHGVIRAYENSNQIWEYNTPSAMIASHSTISELHVNSDIAYIAVSGTLYALDLYNGSIKWTVNNIGMDNDLEFDNYGNIYVCGYPHPNVVVIDKNGNELYRDEDESYGDVTELDIEGNNLKIHYWNPIEGTKLLDISRFSANSDIFLQHRSDEYMDENSGIEVRTEGYLTNEEIDSAPLWYKKIRAYTNNELIWEYTTEKARDVDAITISDIFISDYSVYIVVNKTLYALDIYLGQVKWTVSDVGDGNDIEFDKYGNIYVGSYWEIPPLTVIDKNGKELYRDEREDFIIVEDLKIDGNYLNINGWKWVYNEKYDSNEEVEFNEILDITQFRPDEINVVFNADTIEFDQPPVIVDGRTLVPIRAVIEAMGGNVEWDDNSKTTTLTLNGNTINLTIGSTIAYLNGEAKQLDVPPQIINSRTLMPIRFIAEGFKFKVDWNNDTKTVIISTDSITGVINEELLSCLGKTRAEIEDLYGKIVESDYWDGGYYYINNDLKSMFFYDIYADNIQDLPQNAKSWLMFAHVTDLINLPKNSYTLDELSAILGKYEVSYPSEDYAMYFYEFSYGEYNIVVATEHKYPEIESVEVGKRE